MTSQPTPTINLQKYGGKQVAIMDGRMVAQGRALKEVLERARRRFPSRPVRDFHILAVPKDLATIYHASR